MRLVEPPAARRVAGDRALAEAGEVPAGTLTATDGHCGDPQMSSTNVPGDQRGRDPGGRLRCAGAATGSRRKSSRFCGKVVDAARDKG